MIHVIASIHVKDGHHDEFLDVFKSNVPNVRAEEGCIDYFPTVDIDADLAPQKLDESVVTIIERWESVDALRNHIVAPHMLSYKEKVKDIVETVTIKVLQEV